MIPDRFFYPLIALLVAALIGLAMEWPQGDQGIEEAIRNHRSCEQRRMAGL